MFDQEPRQFDIRSPEQIERDIEFEDQLQRLFACTKLPKKLIITSTPRYRGKSIIQQMYENSDD